jgi:hypothetical protein
VHERSKPERNSTDEEDAGENIAGTEVVAKEAG